MARDPVFNKAMEKVGRCLNLKKHTVGRQRVPIIGPGDIEGTRPTRIRLTPAIPAQILTLNTRHTHHNIQKDTWVPMGATTCSITRGSCHQRNRH